MVLVAPIWPHREWLSDFVIADGLAIVVIVSLGLLVLPHAHKSLDI